VIQLLALLGLHVDMLFFFWEQSGVYDAILPGA